MHENNRATQQNTCKNLSHVSQKPAVRVESLGHMHYILWLTDPDRDIPGLSKRQGSPKHVLNRFNPTQVG